MTVTNSLYEQFSDLTTIQKLRYWEWFNGDVINSFIWREITSTGGSGVMQNDIDEGFRITTNASSSARRGIDMGDILQFNEDNAIMMAVSRRVTSTNAQAFVGFNDNAGVGSWFSTGSDNSGYLDDTGVGTHKGLITTNGGTFSHTDSPIDRNTEWTISKVIMTAANHQLELNLQPYITKTTDLPSANQQMSAGILARAAVATVMDIRYMEAWNT